MTSVPADHLDPALKLQFALDQQEVNQDKDTERENML
jgi:hypothetical protein